jgi:hypothetical protein
MPNDLREAAYEAWAKARADISLAEAHPTSRSTGRTGLDGSRPGLIISANC